MEIPDAESMHRRHRVEQRELQVRIAQKKRNATKKTRKGINDECAALEIAMKEQQSAEIAALSRKSRLTNIAPGAPEETAGESDGPTEQVQESKDSENPPAPLDDLQQATEGLSVANQAQTRKPNRQKARLARRAANQAAVAEQASLEVADVPDRRAEERTLMTKEMASRSLAEKEVRSDGHCLYAAIADQLVHRQIPHKNLDAVDYKDIRNDAADYILSHRDEFEAFVEEPLDEYIAKVRYTGEWGGQLEMLAIAKSYGISINVLQGTGRVERIEPMASSTMPEIWLAYYRHHFGLGEHYNSLRVER